MDDEPTPESVLAELWDSIRGWRPDNVHQLSAARPLLAAGVPAEDVARALNAATYEATFATLYAVCALPDTDGLHEELLTADPTGRDGADLFA